MLCNLEQAVVRVNDLPQNHITALGQNAKVHAVGVEYVTTIDCQRILLCPGCSGRIIKRMAEEYPSTCFDTLATI